MQRVEHAAAFVLHQRPWGERGRVFELFARDHGRISVFAQGVRGPQARLAGVMQPFVPLLVSWAGRGESPRLTGAEPDPALPRQVPLPAGQLMSAWYLTELLLMLTIRSDPHPELYLHYAAALQGLRTVTPARELRLFEKRLLDALGYGLPDLEEAHFSDPVAAELLRPQLRAALDRCLEGRNLKTRDVAKSLLGLGRPGR